MAVRRTRTTARCEREVASHVADERMPEGALSPVPAIAPPIESARAGNISWQTPAEFWQSYIQYTMTPEIMRTLGSRTNVVDIIDRVFLALPSVARRPSVYTHVLRVLSKHHGQCIFPLANLMDPISIGFFTFMESIPSRYSIL